MVARESSLLLKLVHVQVRPLFLKLLVGSRRRAGLGVDIIVHHGAAHVQAHERSGELIDAPDDLGEVYVHQVVAKGRLVRVRVRVRVRIRVRVGLTLTHQVVAEGHLHLRGAMVHGEVDHVDRHGERHLAWVRVRVRVTVRVRVRVRVRVSVRVGD